MEKIILKNILNENVNLEIVDNEDDANFITHSGTFHADEVMATVFLLNKYGDIKLYRTSTPTNKEAFIYDVGFGEFDHHALDFDKIRDNGIKYASCGLIWEKYGMDISSKLNINDVKSFYDVIEKNIVMDIDRDDNGQALKNEPEIKMQNIPNLIASFNPNWDDLSSEDKCFLNAVCFANTIFNNISNNIISKQKAKVIIDEKINESENGILILDNYMPWKEIVLSSNNPKAKDILYAVFPSKRGGYNVVATPQSPGSFTVKKPFPSNWAGKEGLELQKISGINTITFCHKNLFICACETYKDAIKIAELSLNNKED